MLLQMKDSNESVFRDTSSAGMSTSTKSFFYAGYSAEELESCELNRVTTKEMEKDKSRLSYFLLLLHGLRVLFTKTLVFNVLFTIRALLASRSLPPQQRHL
ncbi:uncharacterized protein trdc [Genypterus blacodes]|uniref:uncharacterized protein trdc n=1 Tax=Genypterus blacodes TaxID=154954 RepID=UPI003F760F7B